MNSKSKKLEQIIETMVRNELSQINESKNDYVANYNHVRITLKNGYKYLSEQELDALYLKIGNMIKDTDLQAQRIDVIF